MQLICPYDTTQQREACRLSPVDYTNYPIGDQILISSSDDVLLYILYFLMQPPHLYRREVMGKALTQGALDML